MPPGHRVKFLPVKIRQFDLMTRCLQCLNCFVEHSPIHALDLGMGQHDKYFHFLFFFPMRQQK